MSHIEDYEDIIAVTKIGKKLIVITDSNSKELKFNTEADTVEMYEKLKSDIEAKRTR